ncbi:hypothetical protein [Phyllobacterium chamaecytisi]|uniref:hypothetical protein n=1 Tax=Phyllobacterium chamaecytisi TaxID=2876082 RepID=UPI001CCC7308|nr:hypothetical protein [Phyllobacterium sp. KW56]MBZ9602608.1 hypothetical protein [Phyllobacterium sp. KW56]
MEIELPFDGCLIAKTKPASDLVAYIVADYLTNEEPRRARRRNTRAHAQLVATIQAFILEVVLIRQEEGHDGCIFITANNRMSRYLPKTITLEADKVYKELGRLGWLTVKLGTKYSTEFNAALGNLKATTLAASDKLMAAVEHYRIDRRDTRTDFTNSEVIRLSDTEKNRLGDAVRTKAGTKTTYPVEYDDTPATIAARKTMNAINGLLETANVAIVGTRSVNGNRRKLIRQYGCGDLSFTKQGRMFGGFWINMSKRDRQQFIRLDGEEIAEVDFGQMYPRLLYNHFGQQPPDGDMYWCIDGCETEDMRDALKVFVNAMLFTDKFMVGAPKGTEVLLAVHDKEWWRSAIVEAHPLLAECYGEGLGHDLQWQESQIMTAVTLRLLESGMAALPVHDAMLCPKPKGNLVKTIMEEEYHKFTGFHGSVKIANPPTPRQFIADTSTEVLPLVTLGPASQGDREGIRSSSPRFTVK